MILKWYSFYFKKKLNIFLLISLFLIYYIIFLYIKNSLYYETFKYINTYLRYYVHEYYNDDLNLFKKTFNFNVFVENDLFKLLSVQLISKLTHDHLLFQVLLFIQPFIIYYSVNYMLYDEIHQKTWQFYALRIGKRKYFIKKIFSTLLIVLTLTVLPRLFYILNIYVFFINGFSNVHNLDQPILFSNITSFKNLYIQPTTALYYDFISLIIYSCILTILSVYVVLIKKSKMIGSIIFIMILVIWNFLFETFHYTTILGKNFAIPDLVYQFSYYRYANLFYKGIGTEIFLFQIVILFIISSFMIDKIRRLNGD